MNNYRKVDSCINCTSARFKYRAIDEFGGVYDVVCARMSPKDTTRVCSTMVCDEHKKSKRNEPAHIRS